MSCFLDPIRLFDYLVENGVPDISHLLPELVTPAVMAFFREILPKEWRTDLDMDNKIHTASQIVDKSWEIVKKGQGHRLSDEGREDDDGDGEDDGFPAENSEKFEGGSSWRDQFEPNGGRYKVVVATPTSTKSTTIATTTTAIPPESPWLAPKKYGAFPQKGTTNIFKS